MQQKFTHGGYKHLHELTWMLVTKGCESENYVMKHPGKLRRTRWMAKLLYCIKSVLLSKNETKNFFSMAEVATGSQKNKLETLCVFVVIGDLYAKLLQTPFHCFLASKNNTDSYSQVIRLFTIFLTYPDCTIVSVAAGVIHSMLQAEFLGSIK